MRLLHHGLAVATLLAALAQPAAALGQAGVPDPTGPDFKALLLADAKVTPAIKAALRNGTAFAQPAAFGDLTGDGVSDAVVLVTTPGAAGSVATYVLSALAVKDGSLKVVYRSQALYRAFVRATNGALVVLTADYARGDDVCCPAATLQRSYTYDRHTKLFRRVGSLRIPRPS